MARILIAEDSRTQAADIQFRLEEAGHEVKVEPDGDRAYASLTEQPPDILLTDLHMPGKNGLELTEFVRSALPDIPVVLMTADGTEELAVEALRKGASNYIPKRLIERDLISTIDGIAATLESRRTQRSVLHALTHSESTYTFGNDRDFATSLIAHLEAEVKNMNYDDETGLFRIVTALKEAILNAIDHGNLELDSSLREEGDGSAFYRLGEERLTQEPYCWRKVSVTSRVSPEQLAFVIRDEGNGFDRSLLPDPEDPENLLRSHGRGILLIRNFMDDVVFNEVGNQITMIKYRVDQQSDTSDEPPMLAESTRLNILLAEDSLTNQVLARSLLERQGHSVTVASTGVEAVRMSADFSFDLILMDVEMPEQDGISATREIRERDSTGRQIPIIAMTAHDTPADQQACRDAGMNGHISKPVQIETLLAALQEL